MSLKEAVIKMSEAPKVEEVSTPEAEEKSSLAGNFDKIAKQERHISEIRKQLEESKKSFAAEKEELNRYREIDKSLKIDPLGTLTKIGLTPERIQQLANERTDPRNAAERRAMAAIEELKRELSEKEGKEQQEKVARSERYLNNMIQEQITSQEYDIIEDFGAQAAVKEFLEAYHEEVGEVPDSKEGWNKLINDACEAVAQEIYGRVSKTTKSKYFAKASGRIVEEKVPDPIRKESRNKDTLSNKLAQSIKVSPKIETEQDREKAALEIIRRARLSS